MSASRDAHLERIGSQPRVQGHLEAFASQPPRALLLEGGVPEEREALALFWAARLNCRSEVPPCRECGVCRQIEARAFRDLFLFDGREGSITIGQVREARQVMGQRPDAGSVRVLIFSEAQELTEAAANALLKSLEEPLPGNAFVLLVPQRSWLLPTLVSRSFVLTLSWTRRQEPLYEAAETWRQRLLQFWRQDRGLFEHTAKKSEVDRHLVQDILGDCRAALRDLLAGEPEHPLAAQWSRSLTPERAAALDRVLEKAFQALRHQTTPSLVLDWVALQVRQRLHSRPGSG